MVGLFAPIWHYIETLVHPTAQQDALTAARHRAFIAPRLLGGVVALACFPIYLLARGAPSAIELVVFAWLVAPILIAYFLSRTGRYESAHVLSAFALTALVTVVAISTGGIASFAAIWLVVVPLEASLSASRRVVAAASVVALGAAGILVSLVLANHAIGGNLRSPQYVWPLCGLTVVLSFLMVSNMKFRSFKELKFNARTVAFVLFIVASSAIISLQTNPAFVLTWLLACYIVLALVEFFVGIPKARRERQVARTSIPPSK